jgi:hypothetical protein
VSVFLKSWEPQPPAGVSLLKAGNRRISEELHNAFSAPNNIKVINKWREGIVGHTWETK